jgi:glutamate/tyrosine decarboxylase-like PLP-dependent enzyme
LAHGFAEWVRCSDEFELATVPVLPIVTFRIKSVVSPGDLSTLDQRIVDEVTRDGQRWISQTIVNGASVLRMMVISYLTEERHLKALEAALKSAAQKMMVHAETG